MATEAEDLAAAILLVTAKIRELVANPKPSYSIDGQSVSWGTFYKDQVELRNQLKAALVNAEGPWEQHVQGSA